MAMEAPQADHRHARLLPLAALVVGNVALALGPWFVRLADSGPVSAGFWRVALALPVLALLARVNGQRLGGVPRGMVAAVLVGGVLFGLDVASWHLGIGLTRMANATLFGNAGSLILMVWGFVAWRRMPRGREWPAMAAALGGDLFCLLAGVLYAGYLLILQGARKALGSWALLAWSSLGSAPVLLGIALMLGEPVWPTDWAPILGLVVTSQLIGQGLLVYALKHFSPLVIGIALLTQPAVAALVGWLSFGEVLTALDLLGVALVGSALVLAKVAGESTGPGEAVSSKAAGEV